MKLIIGNRNYSSWSLRAWLFLRANGIAFEEHRLTMFQGDWERDVRRFSPAARVPVLIDGDITVWDTLAIFEYVLETGAAHVGWPTAQAQRAHARSIVAEMHSGFLAVRGELPQNLRRRHRLRAGDLSPDCRSQLARIDALWCDCLDRYGGPWLFGDFGLADIMYTPVALRLVTYGLEFDSAARSFIDAVKAHPLVGEWVGAARAEPEALDFIDELAPLGSAPLTLG